MTHNQYNSYNLEVEFKMYLESKNYGSATVKNYLADLKSFFLWDAENFETTQGMNSIEKSMEILLSNEHLEEYIDSLRSSGKPISSINRSMSTLRKFSSFCISQGWITTNSAKQVDNLSKLPTDAAVKEALIASFQKELVHQKMSTSSRKNYLMDAREYLHITSSLT
ncbi:MAG: site-specific integrase [Candidatus Roizmanbacteria bacterium]|nr:site-specific integrase [Candidatus Roizmanbacteria bacterium]